MNYGEVSVKNSGAHASQNIKNMRKYDNNNKKQLVKKNLEF